MGIPLYLSALLTLPSGADFPETKEAVLRMFVQQNKSAPDKIEVLERDTLGQHATMLVGLAVEANRAANTVISDSNAKRTISSIVQLLCAEGQIGGNGWTQARVCSFRSHHGIAVHRASEWAERGASRLKRRRKSWV